MTPQLNKRQQETCDRQRSPQGGSQRFPRSLKTRAPLQLQWSPGEFRRGKGVCHGTIPAVDPAEVLGAGANLKRRLTSLFILLNASR
jgi:hypothetical protein